VKHPHAVFVVAALACAVLTAAAQTQDRAAEKLDTGMISAIRDEGLAHSQAMDHVIRLADVYGPRVTGSPGLRQAGDWAIKKLGEWGLSNVHKEPWPFGKGWSLVRFSAHMIEPQVQPLIGYPKSWTPGTSGAVTADVVRADINTDADFEKYRGKLARKIVLTQPARDVRMLEGIIVQRWTDALLKEAESTPPAAADTPARDRSGQPTQQERIQQFLMKEGVIATLDRGADAFLVAGDNQMSWRTQRTDGGTVFVTTGGPHDSANAGAVVPSVTLAVEHYNRMVRVLDQGIPVKVELDIQTRFHDETELNGFNVIADLPGSDLANEIVLIGAHLDSHQSGTGATDNAAGCAAMMEAMRILKAVGARPRRTIRLALWGGEEEGMLGSKAYVKEHLGDPAARTARPEYQNLSAYYNLDNGTGRVHGVWLQGNLAIAPIFRAWFEPLRDLGVTTIAPRSVSGSDYQSFDAVGIPAFQFMQDRLEYNSRTHHSNMDTVDRVQRDDLVQMAVVATAFAYNTAIRPEKLPRKTPPLARPPATEGGR
jgi:carboxypeptidase Q